MLHKLSLLASTDQPKRPLPQPSPETHRRRYQRDFPKQCEQLQKKSTGTINYEAEYKFALRIRTEKQDALGIPKKLQTIFRCIRANTLPYLQSLITDFDFNQLSSVFDEEGHNVFMLAHCYGRKEILACLYQHIQRKNFHGRMHDETGWALLGYTICCGTIDDVRTLLENHTDVRAYVNQQTSNGNTPLLLAALLGRIDVVLLLLDLGADINHQLSDGSTALHLAAARGYTVVAQWLLQRNADVQLKNNAGETALYIAAKKDETEVTVLLLESNDGGDELRHAAKLGNVIAIQCLTECGARIEHEPLATNTPVYIAAQHKQRTIIAFYVKRSHHFAELHIAAILEDFQVMSFLLLCGVSVNQVNHVHATPLYSAASAGKLESVRFLLRNGANAMLVAIGGDTATYIAAERGHAEVVSYLTQAKPRTIHSAVIGGATPLFAAVEQNFPTIVRCLLQGGTDVNHAKEDGTTPLYIAAERGLIDLADALVKAGANVNTAAKDGSTPLHAATRYKHLEMIEKLLAAGAHIDAQDSEGNTVLHIAVQSDSLAIVHWLLQKGAKYDKAKHDGTTPLQTAEHYMYQDIATLLHLWDIKQKNQTRPLNHQLLALLCPNMTVNAQVSLLFARLFRKEGAALVDSLLSTKHPNDKRTLRSIVHRQCFAGIIPSDRLNFIDQHLLQASPSPTPSLA